MQKELVSGLRWDLETRNAQHAHTPARPHSRPPDQNRDLHGSQPPPSIQPVRHQASVRMLNNLSRWLPAVALVTCAKTRARNSTSL